MLEKVREKPHLGEDDAASLVPKALGDELLHLAQGVDGRHVLGEVAVVPFPRPVLQLVLDPTHHLQLDSLPHVVSRRRAVRSLGEHPGRLKKRPLPKDVSHTSS